MRCQGGGSEGASSGVGEMCSVTENVIQSEPAGVSNP